MRRCDMVWLRDVFGVQNEHSRCNKNVREVRETQTMTLCFAALCQTLQMPAASNRNPVNNS